VHSSGRHQKTDLASDPDVLPLHVVIRPLPANCVWRLRCSADAEDAPGQHQPKCHAGSTRRSHHYCGLLPHKLPYYAKNVCKEPQWASRKRCWCVSVPASLLAHCRWLWVPVSGCQCNGLLKVLLT
jgi:hypothetical protein